MMKMKRRKLESRKDDGKDKKEVYCHSILNGKRWEHRKRKKKKKSSVEDDAFFFEPCGSFLVLFMTSIFTLIQIFINSQKQ